MKSHISFTLEPPNAQRLANLCGQFNEHLRQVEERLHVKISNRGQDFHIEGLATVDATDGSDASSEANENSDAAEAAVQAAKRVLLELYREKRDITPDMVHLLIQEARPLADADKDADYGDEAGMENVEAFSVIRTRKGTVKPRGANQQRYVRSIQQQDINFGIGPAGTGKTYLAVACAVQALEEERVRRILLVRPAVEAGEKLGFLPGDLSQKIDPYLRPLYDALYEMLGFETVGRLIERNIIEVAPLAYMRGRTLNNSFIILDESQNTTRAQMKMFLTRIGFGSTAVITGDLTQIDLPRKQESGLLHVSKVLANVPGIAVTSFQSRDVVRHALVQRIVEAYDVWEQAEEAEHDAAAGTEGKHTG